MWMGVSSPDDVSPVGASLLAMTLDQPALMSLIHRYREQARSHRGWCSERQQKNIYSSICNMRIFIP
jgi:hypothetical protein